LSKRKMMRVAWSVRGERKAERSEEQWG